MAETATRRVGPGARWGATAVAAALLGVLTLSAWLTPAPEGHATHTQLGLPQCGWVARFNKPCPTCGMTTAFALAAHGDISGSLRAQPFAAAASLTTAIGFWAAAHVAFTGSRLGGLAASALTPRILWGVAATAVAAWAYKLFTWN
ncbi:MAG: DUF2752 domain-containing protein [Phycisphaerales bacterium]|nr:DUF2752 domain-containing protein [Phycisphaerales bacterium]